MWHQKRFPEFYHFTTSFNDNNNSHYNPAEYDLQSHIFLRDSARIYTNNHKKIRENQEPDLIHELIQEILCHKPSAVALSVVYSSQAFYTLSLLQKLKELSIPTIIGGGAITQQLRNAATHTLKNEVELLNFVEQKQITHETLKSAFPLDYLPTLNQNYFSPQNVFTLKTTISCYYQQCTFCSHHQNKKYQEFPLSEIEQTIINNNMKFVFFIDDMIHKKRLLELGAICKRHNVKWMCQLRPTRDLDQATLNTLYHSGLRIVLWGVESASERIINLMKKGTSIKDAAAVLHNSKEVGIKNVLYIMFGFPTETKDEFLQTIQFLRDNSKNIDLVSTSIFGLQQGTPAYENPQAIGITEINHIKRTILEPKISYTTSTGLSQDEANQLRKSHKKSIDAPNKYPKAMNFLREHMFFTEE